MTRFVRITKECGPAAAIMYEFIHSRNGEPHSIDRMVDCTGIKRLAVIRAITVLEGAGFIKIERRRSKISVFRCVVGDPNPVTRPQAKHNKKAAKSRKTTTKKKTTAAAAEKPRVPRKRDLLFDWICDRWFDGKVTKGNSARIAKLAHGFREYGADQAEIAAREERYRSGADWTFTPEALLKHWVRFKDDCEASTEMFPDDPDLQPIPDDYRAEKPWERARRLKQETGGTQ